MDYLLFFFKMRCSLVLPHVGLFRFFSSYCLIVQQCSPEVFFFKTFYYSSFFFLNSTILNLPLTKFSLISNLLRIISAWSFFFNNFFIIGFELWGLGLNYFLINRHTKFGKRYKDKKKKKKLTAFNQISINLINRLKLLQKDENFCKKNFHLLQNEWPGSKFNFLQNGFQYNVVRLRRKFSFKVGLSHRIGLFEPFFLRVLDQHKLSDFRRKRFLLIATERIPLKNLSLFLRYFKGLNEYKFRGMKFMREDITIKVGKVGRT